MLCEENRHTECLIFLEIMRLSHAARIAKSVGEERRPLKELSCCAVSRLSLCRAGPSGRKGCQRAECVHHPKYEAGRTLPCAQTRSAGRLGVGHIRASKSFDILWRSLWVSDEVSDMIRTPAHHVQALFAASALDKSVMCIAMSVLSSYRALRMCQEGMDSLLRRFSSAGSERRFWPSNHADTGDQGVERDEYWANHSHTQRAG